MRYLVMSLFTFVLLVAGSTAAQVNDHTLIGTATSEGCQYYPAQNPDWICWISVQVNGDSITCEEQGQAIGQGGQMRPTLPRKVAMKFVLVPAGFDFARNLIRTQCRAYYLYDLGPA